VQFIFVVNKQKKLKMFKNIISFIISFTPFFTQVIYGMAEFNAAKIADMYGTKVKEEEETDEEKQLREQEEAAKIELEKKKNEKKPGDDTKKEDEKKDDDKSDETSFTIGDKDYDIAGLEAEVGKLEDDSETIEINGEELTKAEALELITESKKAAGIDETKGHTIGKKLLSDAEYTDFVSKAAKHYEWDEDDIKNMPAKTLQKLLVQFDQHLDAEKSIKDRHQQNAKEKREIDKQRIELSQGMQERIDMRTNLEKDIKELEDNIKAKKDLIAKDPDDEANETAKNKLISRQTTAEETLKADEKELQRLKGRDANIEAQQSAIWVRAMILDLQTDPVFSTGDENVEDILAENDQALAQGKQYTGDKHTLRVAKQVRRILNDYEAFLDANPKAKTGIMAFYNSNKEDYPDLSAKRTKAAQTDSKQGKTDSLKESFLKAFKKQKENPLYKKGGGGAGGSTLTEDQEHDREAEELKKRVYSGAAPK